MMIGRIAQWMIGLGLAAALSQFPEYAQQYQQRLGGAIDELTVIVARFDTNAAAAGLDRAGALARYEAATDSFLIAQGADWRQTFARLDWLEQAQQTLSAAGPVERIVNLPALLDPAIARRTLASYQPAVPVTIEGLTLAGIGLVAGLGIGAGAGWLVRRGRRRARPVGRA